MEHASDFNRRERTRTAFNCTVAIWAEVKGSACDMASPLNAGRTFREAVARCVQLGADGLCRRRDRPEFRDQLIELVRGQRVVRRRGQLVGEGLDPLPGLPAGGGERPGGVHEPPVAQRIG